MKVFLDTNILVDIADNRDFAHQGRLIYQFGVRGFIDVYASYLTFANLNYIFRRKACSERYDILRGLRQGITVLPCDTSQLDTALAHGDVRDFEDLLQYQCAVAGGCDVVVTNNTKDYQEFCEIPFMSSREFLIRFFAQQDQEH